MARTKQKARKSTGGNAAFRPLSNGVRRLPTPTIPHPNQKQSAVVTSGSKLSIPNTLSGAEMVPEALQVRFLVANCTNAYCHLELVWPM